MYQWEDGTVGQYYRYFRPLTAVWWVGIEQAGALWSFSLLKTRNVAAKLCEKEETLGDHIQVHGLPETPEIQRTKPAKSPAGFPHVVCSSGHYTHDFLACDAQSACQQGDITGYSSGSNADVTALCKSTLATLFTCKSEVEYVPYSLVCDHSQDCLDSSDEDFCVYPSCSGSRLFECTSGQVMRKRVARYKASSEIRHALTYSQVEGNFIV